ncbi:MAG: alpha/beta hydrolase [Thermomicrobiales bacterium]
MAVADVRFLSNAFERWTTYSIFLPESGDGPFPVVIQLHGLGDDHRSWIERSNIIRHAQDLPLVIVFPDGGTSGYLNWNEAGRLHRQAWETLIVDDLASHIRTHFNVTRGPWGIGGLSMGGYGAMHIGLKYPERFASIWSHSAAFHLDQHLDADLMEQQSIGDANIGARLRAMVAADTNTPCISFDCGVDDELIDYNREIHALMTELGIAHHYAEHHGGHTWDYWDDHVREALEQHCDILLSNTL